MAGELQQRLRDWIETHTVEGKPLDEAALRTERNRLIIDMIGEEEERQANETARQQAERKLKMPKGFAPFWDALTLEEKTKLTTLSPGTQRIILERMQAAAQEKP